MPWDSDDNKHNDKSKSSGPWGQKRPTERPSSSQPGKNDNTSGNSRPDVFEDFIKTSQDKLKLVWGNNKNNRGNGTGGGGNNNGSGNNFNSSSSGNNNGGLSFKSTALLVGLAITSIWIYASTFRVEPEEAAIVLTLGKYEDTRAPGLNFAAWPIQTYEILPVLRENSITIGNTTNSETDTSGLMLTGDENIVDIGFQLVWNIPDPEKYLFTLANPEEVIRGVSESVMREVIGKSKLKPILNRDRALISEEVKELIQSTLESYGAGINIVRVNFDRADPPQQVINSFRDVQAAEQDRDTLEKRAGIYANERLAEARGQAEQIKQESESYSARIVAQATGEAARFISIYEAYRPAKDITRKRMYLEMMEEVLGSVDKVIIDQKTSAGQSGNNVVPYLPLNELMKKTKEPANE